MNKKVLMIAGVAMTALLGGCANTTALEESVANLSNKVDQLSADVNALKSVPADVKDAKAAAMDAQAEAKRANDRLDNVASSYKK